MLEMIFLPFVQSNCINSWSEQQIACRSLNDVNKITALEMFSWKGSFNNA